VVDINGLKKLQLNSKGEKKKKVFHGASKEVACWEKNKTTKTKNKNTKNTKLQQGECYFHKTPTISPF